MPLLLPYLNIRNQLTDDRVNESQWHLSVAYLTCIFHNCTLLVHASFFLLDILALTNSFPAVFNNALLPMPLISM